MAKRYGLPKGEIIRGKSTVSELFKSNDSALTYPLRAVFASKDSSDIGSVTVLFSVGKRYHKRAVKRNKVRRRIKEAYRLNKSDLYDYATQHKIDISVCYLYVAKQELLYDEIERAIKKLNVNVLGKIKKASEVNIDTPVDPIG